MTKSPSKAVALAAQIAGLFAKSIVTIINVVFVTALFGFAGVIANGVADTLHFAHFNFAEIASIAGLLGLIWKESQ